MAYTDLKKDTYMGMSYDAVPEDGEILTKDFFVDVTKYFLDDKSLKTNVSFDEFKSIFNETIKKDRISTSNCFVELAGNSSDLFKTYRLNKGFKNFLLDKNGVIVAKDITPSQLSSYLN